MKSLTKWAGHILERYRWEGQSLRLCDNEQLLDALAEALTEIERLRDENERKTRWSTSPIRWDLPDAYRKQFLGEENSYSSSLEQFANDGALKGLTLNK